jgi:ATP-dependent Clp protease ATP-binding subunit ClpC
MFERYDELARRALFYARYEASRLGISVIEPEHLLLGVIRSPKGATAALLDGLPLADVRIELESTLAPANIPTSVEIPFSEESKQVLQYTCEEADALKHRAIGAEHLVLGLLRTADSHAAATLARYGLQLESARETLKSLTLDPS